jgi:type IV secretory pathway VirJ component
MKLALLALLVIQSDCSKGPMTGIGGPPTVTLQLTRGDFSVRVYEPVVPVKSIIVFGSGDGGWKDWEEHACRALSLAGHRVIGWDCRRYADKPYDVAILGTDLRRMSLAGLKNSMGHGPPAKGDPLPVLYGGYSTGAEQAVAAAVWSAGNSAPPAANYSIAPAGLLLVAPGERGRYGITTSDLMGIKPHGPGSFSLGDLAGQLPDLPVAQIHGTLDPLDSTDWLASLRGPVHLVTIAGTGHFFGDADAELQRGLVESASWILSCLTTPLKKPLHPAQT